MLKTSACFSIQLSLPFGLLMLMRQGARSYPIQSVPCRLKLSLPLVSFFHAVLKKFDMALPSTFILDQKGGGTWTSRLGSKKRIDYVAIPRAWLPTVSAAGVDERVHLDINLKVDHSLTQVTMHLPAAQSHGDGKPKPLHMSRLALKLPHVIQSLQTRKR